MSKVDVNNEIVLMRHTVRKVRLHVVRKLIKQVKSYGSKKGDDKQLEKYKRKSDKLGQELIALKKLKDDEISRYSITRENKSLEEILADQKSDPETRVLARLATHKIISDRVAKFKEKFPNFEAHLGPGRRKLIKLKRKAGKLAKKEAKLTAESSEREEKDKQDSDVESNSKDEDDDEDNDSVENREEIDESLSQIKEENQDPESAEKIENNKRKAEITSSENKRIKTKAKDSSESKTGKLKSVKRKEKADNLAGISTTSKEAAVKSFARFLEENEEQSEVSPGVLDGEETNEKEIVLEKEVDSFFMTEDGGGEYLSVVVPKSNITEDEEGGEARGFENPNSFRSRNNRFFDKVDDRFDKTKQNGNGRDKSRFLKGDRFKDRIAESRGNSKTFDSTRKNINAGMKSRDYQNPEKSSTENNMHPSWAAKKKQQEILKLGFQGKKIVFD